ncbi:MAG: 4-(cytidine 5'-diphospho)-2-C-methyl-D-erythritol kinase [Paracoccus sp. (in: a-proteobacteria)]|uniref:4-(cytidine 5'-diphospho)-2-C-methyl-D-erythritol kinase n=1 Tax=Paracoccus sp. TaxID=267 RepID=UPI0026DEBB80|nr:4-(cytidine 5'-diphospho)-2-C-methyl-D-erythritol kinase [Paracoccus sp. (in: a-proteobacteria)]MDO5612420.1 4-(cytidine 5'-diphospho)-2-C-methyl-D-erythritol kinase [Paracoccus sp. (in: a-proteobacteria)]
MTEPAPAKLNLTLHVTGRRGDGYHLLDSLVVFARVGDVIALSSGALSLRIDGPFAPGLGAGDDNLCLRAARAIGGDAAIRLTKNLPVASGIGGGSADAAAVLRGFARQGLALPASPERLGADVPVCLAGRPARMRGVGEMLDPVPAIPPVPVVLVNPGVAVATPAVFAALDRRDNPPMPAPDWRDAEGLIRFAAACRNDLQAPAIRIAPAIGDVLDALTATGARLARMSGSGATCFGLFDTPAQARAAADALRRPGWWVAQTELSG